MILGIRTETADATLILSSSDGAVKDKQAWTAGRMLSEQLLVEIEDLLKNNEQSWADLEGVVVFAGPGSFTGLRIGITVANAIAFERKIKVVGAGGDDWFVDGIKNLASVEVGQIALPKYGGEAHITKPKK